MLHSYQQYLPISIVGEERTVNEVQQQTLIQTRPDSKGEVEYIPLRELVKVRPAEDLKRLRQDATVNIYRSVSMKWTMLRS